MKTKLLFIILISISVPLFSQTEDIYKKIAKETCECLAKKNYDYATANQSEVEMTLGLCMLGSVESNKLDVDVSDNTAMTALGEKIGLLMVSVCPDVFKVFMRDEKKETEADEEETEFFTVAGTVKSVEEKEFFYVNLKDDTGKDMKCIWMYYFTGSDAFKDDPKKLVGKKVQITYIVLEVLQPKTKVYYKLNVISGLVVE